MDAIRRFTFIAAAALATSFLCDAAPSAASVSCEHWSSRYKADDRVDLWVKRVGPYANPQESYDYYALPYCAPDTINHPENPHATGHINAFKAHSIGELLRGNTLRHSGHHLIFPNDTANHKEVHSEEACTTESLTDEQVELFATAARDQWFYQWQIDGLPVWGMVGEMLPDLDGLTSESPPRDFKPYVYTERELYIRYNDNGDRIVGVDLISLPASLTAVEPGARLKFKLAISWQISPIPFDERLDRYLDHGFFRTTCTYQRSVNWVGILCLLATALMLRRVLKKDYARYALVRQRRREGARTDEEGGIELPPNGILWLADSTTPLISRDSGDEGGWKMLHGDVFRTPSNLPLLASMIGLGWQITTLILTAGTILSYRCEEASGPLDFSLILLSNLVAGLAAGRYFRAYSSPSSEGGDGARDEAGLKYVVIYTSLLAPCVVAAAINMVAMAYRAFPYVSFGFIFKTSLFWLQPPTCAIGVLVGKRHCTTLWGANGDNPFPCRINETPRPIPTDARWYCKPLVLVPIVGLVSFMTLFHELYYFMTILWQYKFFVGGAFHIGVLIILCLVVGGSTIIVVYVCLRAENYLWQRISFLAGGSTAVFMFIYSIYYYWFRTRMHGVLQNTIYFGTMSIISACIGILCGTMSHFAADRFVRTIFRNIKVD